MAYLVFPQLKTLPTQLPEFIDSYSDEQIYEMLLKTEETITWLKQQYK